jgi:hypothetical protein
MKKNLKRIIFTTIIYLVITFLFHYLFYRLSFEVDSISNTLFYVGITSFFSGLIGEYENHLSITFHCQGIPHSSKATHLYFQLKLSSKYCFKYSHSVQSTAHFLLTQYQGQDKLSVSRYLLNIFKSSGFLISNISFGFNSVLYIQGFFFAS